jgi:transcriptional regulator with XRE-family HTH domain
VAAVREDHDHELEARLPKVGEYPAAGLVRRARRMMDYSQRQMARIAQVAPSTVGKVESGAITPSLDLIQRLLGTAGLFLVVVDPNGRVITPMYERTDLRDGAGRRYPAHLDTIVDPEPGEWWGDAYGLARPPETFYRNREYRDMERARSQWEVRAKKYRGVPPPPDPNQVLMRRWLERLRRQRPLEEIPEADLPIDEIDDIDP